MLNDWVVKLSLTARLFELQLCHVLLKVALNVTFLPHRTYINDRRLGLEQGNPHPY